MRLTRCYLPGAWRSGDRASLPGNQADHLIKVLRLTAGATVIAFDGDGHSWRTALGRNDHGQAVLQIGERLADEPPQAVQLTLVQSLARGEKMDWVVQKATELGAHALQPLIAERSVVRIDSKQADRKVAHWQAIAVAACEQSERNRLPGIAAPCTIDELTAAGESAVLWVLDPDATGELVVAAKTACATAAVPAAIRLVVGPEGGLTANEAALLRARGAQFLRLGPRVLRTETAAIAALAIVQALLGDLAAPAR